MMLFRQGLLVDRSFFCCIDDLDQNEQKVAKKIINLNKAWKKGAM